MIAGILGLFILAITWRICKRPSDEDVGMFMEF